MHRLRGKRALVTGASSGIGAATARLLAREGADVTPPQIPPLTSYKPEAVTRAAVMCAIDPRRGITVGGSTLLLQAVNAVAWPVTEAAMAAAARVGRPRARPDQAPNALWEPSGDGTVQGGLSGRPSLYAALRRRLPI